MMIFLKNLDRRFCALAMLFLCAATSGAYANDQQLYDAAPPADAAFVRVINASPAGEITASMSDAKFGKVAYPGISPYMVVKQGNQTLKTSTNAKSINLEAGKYYTLAIGQDGAITTLTDSGITEPSKAYVYFYNFSDAPTASLQAVKQKVDIVSDVTAGTSKERTMNALEVDMAIMAEGKTIESFSGVNLQRRSGLSFLLAGKGVERKVIKVENKIQR